MSGSGEGRDFVGAFDLACRADARWYLVTVGVCCGLYVVWAVVVVRGGAVGRTLVGVLAAVLAAGLFLACSRGFRKARAGPLPERGLLRRLVTLPGWLMMLTYPACALGLTVAAAAAIALARVPAAGFVPVVGPIVMLEALGQAGGWLELRRSQAADAG
jgi:hypothetical protein